MSFQTSFAVRFAHCDAAGIVYYPRYIELLDHAVEDWTASTIGVPRREMHAARRLALPLVDLRASFSAVSRLGDMLTFGLQIAKVGRTSLVLRAGVHCGGQLRFAARLTQVLTGLDDLTPVPWPAEWRCRLDEAKG